MKLFSQIFFLLLFAAGFSQATFAVDPVNSDHFGKAIKGYDPVAYFSDGKPVKGKGAYAYEWKGAEWLFATKTNMKAFQSDPEKYAPQYGGYCAWAVSQGSTASIDPAAWTIEKGKLYLNYNQSVRSTWKRDISGNIAKADKNWPRLMGK